MDITRITQNLIVSPSHQQLRESLVEIGDRWAYNRGISTGLGLVTVAHPDFEEKKCGEGVITGIKIPYVVKEDILTKIISSYVFSHLSKCSHQNPVYLHQLE